MRISLLVPCFNEEKAIRKSVNSWLNQTRPIDEIIVVNDCSTDKTMQILMEFKDKITILQTPRNTGNKSYAQEYGLQYVTGDVMITTDGDTLLDSRFAEIIEQDFISNPKLGSVGGQVKSLEYNWLTACRAIDYIFGQRIDKTAQDYIGSVFVIPGAAGAFNTEMFKKYITFDHDTVTEDLDFTYKLHDMGFKIIYNPKAICYTQDPTTIKAYVNQMRRWQGGSWQNLIKHFQVPDHPGRALELTLIHFEGIVFSFLFLILPFINLYMYSILMINYFALSFLIALFAAVKEKRWNLLYYVPHYIFTRYINAYVYFEQFIKEVILRKKSMVWLKADRVLI